MSAAVTKRLTQELQGLMMQPVEGVSAFPNGDNIFDWAATIEGSAGTVYEGLSYKLSVAFSEKYPYEPPTVKFVTSCFHPNVDTAGNICLDILKDKWSAAFSVRTVLMSLQSLLGDPNNDSPLNAYAAQLWDNEEEYKETLHKKYSEASEAPAPEPKA